MELLTHTVSTPLGYILLPRPLVESGGAGVASHGAGVDICGVGQLERAV